jgi:hypothetical protein
MSIAAQDDLCQLIDFILKVLLAEWTWKPFVYITYNGLREQRPTTSTWTEIYKIGLSICMLKCVVI